MVVGDFLLRDEGWGEVSAGAMRPEVRSGARLVGIGEERLRVDAHFDIATIEEGRVARVAQSSYCARDVVTRWRQTECELLPASRSPVVDAPWKLAYNLAKRDGALKRLAATGQEVHWLPFYECQIIITHNCDLWVSPPSVESRNDKCYIWV